MLLWLFSLTELLALMSYFAWHQLCPGFIFIAFWCDLRQLFMCYCLIVNSNNDRSPPKHLRKQWTRSPLNWHPISILSKPFFHKVNRLTFVDQETSLSFSLTLNYLIWIFCLSYYIMVSAVYSWEMIDWQYSFSFFWYTRNVTVRYFLAEK